jgi:hypothetical protein
MPVTVVYAEASRIIRRVVVTDGPAPPGLARRGEATLDVPFSDYNRMNDAALRQHVASIVGPPTHSGRVLELDVNAVVIGLHTADPAIDAPEGAQLDDNGLADVGDVKNAVGEGYVSMKPLFIANRERAILRVMDKEGATRAQAESRVDAAADQLQTDVQRQEAAAQRGQVPVPPPIRE